jgi:hypothetical protein
MFDYPKNRYCFSNHSPVLQCKSSIVSITKRYPKDIANMSYTVYHPSKEKQIEKEKQKQ